MEIGSLEANVLRILKKLGEASAGDIAEELHASRDLAYTTISTTLDRLHKKGLLERRSTLGRTGQKYIYSFPVNPTLQKQIVDKMVDKLVNAFGPSVATTIYDRLTEISPEEAAKLKEAIDAKMKHKGTRDDST